MNSSCIAFIVEGESREPLIIENIKSIFFSNKTTELITLPAAQNIYMLWQKMKEDDFETDIIEVIRESCAESAIQLSTYSRDDFAEIYLFFDYDGHQNNLADNGHDSNDVIGEMLDSFNNETENGKLYISYPMVEALRDFETGTCLPVTRCQWVIQEFNKYKTQSAQKSSYQSFNNYSFPIWQELINVFALRVSCLWGYRIMLSYDDYRKKVTPSTIWQQQQNYIESGKIFVLSCFPEFLLDYYGGSQWRKCTCFQQMKKQCDYR